MQMQSENKPVEEIVAAIQALDLEPIKFKLMDTEEGQGWSREYVEQMEIAYKRFLTLSVKYPEETIAPSKDVDKFWHGHILDTMKYAEDCQNVFGYFVHHFPYFGMRGEEDAANLTEAGKTTNRLYEKEFGEGVPSRAAYCGVAAKSKQDAAYCGVAAKSKQHAAYCGVAAKSKQDAAYCGVAAKSKQHAAYCGVAAKSKQDAAYCGVAAKSKQDAAYCGVAAKSKQDAAYCGVAAKSKQDAAYCGVAAKSKQDAAYCGVAAKSEQDAAYCGVSSNRDKLNTSLRPKLALAA